MNAHPPRTIERHCDVAIIGGSAAGLAAALQLGRQRRSVIVVDDAQPRNAPAAHMHGHLGFEGTPPSALIKVGTEEVRRYGGEVLTARAETITRTQSGHFRVALGGGHAIIARRVLAATGIIDELPPIEGLRELWGRRVIHCPFCHGYEARDQRIVHLATHAMALHPVPMYRQLTPHLTVVVGSEANVEESALAALQASGVKVLRATATRVADSEKGDGLTVAFADHPSIEADVVAVSPRFTARTAPFLELGLQPSAHPAGIGTYVEVNELGETAVPGLYAAGNITDPSQQVAQAVGAGSRVGAMIAFALAQEDVQRAARPQANQADWDHRYSTERMWSGNANGSLVAEVTGQMAGRVLDAGAGEGADAIWLAEQGWQVTASDVSSHALATVAAEAQRRGLEIDHLHADANALEPYPSAAFDLVSAQYASIPRTPDRRAVHNLMSAVAPGGTLLVVSHDLEPMREQAASPEHVPAFDPDSYVRGEDFAEVLEKAPQWQIEVHETRERPPGAASEHRHVQDVVLRARRV